MNPGEILEQKHSITKNKESMGRFNGRLEIAEEKDFEDRSEETIQSKALKVKNIKIQKTG